MRPRLCAATGLALCLLSGAAAAEPAAWKARAEQADGLVGDAFVFVQALPLDEAPRFAQAVQADGYRPVRLRPYRRDDTPRLAGLWLRGSPEGRGEIGLTPDQVRRRDVELRQQGFALADVAGYAAPAGDRYAAVWHKAPPGVAVRFYVGVADERHDETWMALRKEGFCPAALHKFRSADGTLRVSGVWRRQEGQALPWQFRWGSEAAFQARVGEFGSVLLLADVAIYPDRKGPGLAGVWRQDSATGDTFVRGTPPEVRRQGRQLRDRGYTPASIAVTAVEDGGLEAVMVWHRPRSAEVLLALDQVREAGTRAREGKTAEAIDLGERALEVIVREEGATNLRVATLQWNLALWHRRRKEYDRAVALLLADRDVYRTIFGRGKDYAEVLLALGAIYYARSDLVRAVPIYEEACPLLKQLGRADDVEYYSNVAWLGNIYRGRGDFVRAERMYREALPLYEKHLGPRHKNTEGLLRMLAFTLFDQHRFQEAEPVWRTLRRRQQEVLPPDDVNHLLTTRALAYVLYQRGKYRESAKLFEQARARLEHDSDSYVHVLEFLVWLYRELKDAERGIPVCRELLARRAKDPGTDHPSYARWLTALATLYELRSDYKAAEPLLHQAWEIQTRKLGEGDDTTLATLARLCRLHIAAGQLDEAKRQAVHFQEIVNRLHPGGRVQVLLSKILLGEVYQSRGEYDRAEALLSEARDLQAVLSGDNSELVATRLFQLGQLYEKMNRLAQAESAFSRAAEIRRQRLGETSPDHVKALQALYEVQARAGAYAGLEPLARRILALDQKVHGDRHADTGASLDRLGESMVLGGKIAEAVPVFRQALAMRAALLPEDHPARLGSMERLAGMYEITAAQEQALPLRRQLLAVAERARAREPLVYAGRLAALAGLETKLGRNDAAERLYRQACEVVAAARGQESLEYAGCLRDLGGFYLDTGQRPQAEDHLLRAHALVKDRAPRDSAAFRASVTSLVGFYQNLGDTAKADAYRRLLPPGPRPENKAQERMARRRALSEQTNDLLQRGEYARALALLQEAARESRRELGENSVLYLTSLWGLALCYQGLGEGGKAEPLLRQAAGLAARIYGADSPYYGAGLALLGNHHAQFDKPREALADYRQVLALYARAFGAESRSAAAFHGKIGMLHLRLGETGPARSELGLALRGWLRELHATLPGLAEAEALAFLGDRDLWIYRDGYLEALAGQAESARDAHAMLWQTRALLLQYLAGRRLQVSDSPRAADLFRQLQTVRRELAEATYAPTPPDRLEARKQQLARLNQQKEDLEKDLSRASTTFRRDLAARAAGPEETLRHLPGGVALVELARVTRFPRPPQGQKQFDMEEHYEAFVIRRCDQEPGYTVSRVSLGKAEVIDEAARVWPADLVAEASGGRPRRPGPLPEQVLRQRLWLPLEGALGGCHTVLIIPDGTLTRLPWAALPGPKPGSYLVEDYAIALLPYGQQLTSLLAHSATPPREGTMLLAGGIDYNPHGDGTALAPDRRAVWPALEGTLSEVQVIARLWERRGKPRLLRGSAADKQTVLEHLPRSRIAHLATHGFFAEELPPARLPVQGGAELAFRGGLLPLKPNATVTARNPLLLSGLVLAGANRGDVLGLGAGEGILTAEEVSGSDLSGLDLVVLSACDTALGRVEREGVFGLQTAFQLAGAGTVVASLWKVEDRATQVLMVEFYRNLWQQKCGKLEALRRAQLKMLRDFDPVTGSLRGVGGQRPLRGAGPTPPFFWAAFTLSGDWR